MSPTRSRAEIVAEMRQELFNIGDHPAIGVDHIMVQRWADELAALDEARQPQLCSECDGKGTVLDAPDRVLDGRAYMTTCYDCGGTGVQRVKPPSCPAPTGDATLDGLRQSAASVREGRRLRGETR